jgi:hypothetical protein
MELMLLTETRLCIQLCNNLKQILTDMVQDPRDPQDPTRSSVKTKLIS